MTFEITDETAFIWKNQNLRPSSGTKYRGMREIHNYVGFIPYEPTVRKGLGPEGEPEVLDGIWAPVWVYALCEHIAEPIGNTYPIAESLDILQKVIDVCRDDPNERVPAALTVWSLTIGEPVFSVTKAVRYQPARAALRDWVETYGMPPTRFPSQYNLHARVAALAYVPRASFGPKIPTRGGFNFNDS